MKLQVLDLDGSVTAQSGLIARHGPEVLDLQAWGPRLRMGCSWSAFRRFEQELAECWNPTPTLRWLGSGDFHHMTLALLRRIREPYTLVILDKHPDWMRGIPFLHCGTWVWHALKSTPVQQIFHFGGDLDFDNLFRWLAPQRQLLNGQIQVFPAQRTFQTGFWPRVAHQELLTHVTAGLPARRFRELLRPIAPSLQKYPVYLSLDKDVMSAESAAVNWDSGCLHLGEFHELVRQLLELVGDRLLGADIVGDWSPVRMQGLLRQFLHATEHPALDIDADAATALNEKVNLSIMELFQGVLDSSRVVAAGPRTWQLKHQSA